MKNAKHYDGDAITHNGREYRVSMDRDDDMREPWNECDGHGEVSEWTTRDKLPGERVLCSDRSSKRYYDWQGAIATAKRDVWGGEGKTKGERAANAVQADFAYLQAWCEDRWQYLVIGVEDISSGETEYLGGVESNGDYSDDVIMELIGQREYRIAEEEKKAKIFQRFNDAMECGL